MWTWISENWVTILAVTAVVLLLAGAVFVMIRDKKHGKSSCGSSCGNCPMRGSCHKAESK